MTDFVRPDQIFEVPIAGGTLRISPSCDFMHQFPNGAWMLKYWDTDHDPPRMCNVFMEESSAAFLIDHCDLDVAPRTFMGEQEHTQWVGWAATHSIMDLDFEIDDNGASS